ncbi:type II secretion system protein [Desulfocurvus sp. DL9XJH121]
MQRSARPSLIAGFTLVELTAVLVILGTLAGLAVAKYADMMDTARTNAAQGAVAAGRSTLAMAYGSEFISRGREPSAGEVIATATASGVESDFAVEFGGPDESGAITITVTLDGFEVVETWNLP